MGIGASGAKNAGLLAVRILALKSVPLRKSLKEFRKAQRRKVEDADQNVRDQE
jgi:phosphoribosylcarboxyaminoimidazole (NCAIR) mutase